MQVNTQYIESEFEKLSGEQLVELTVRINFSHPLILYF